MRGSILHDSRRRISDRDSIETGRLLAERLCEWMRPKQPNWIHFVDSVGGVSSERSYYEDRLTTTQLLERRA